MIISEGTYYNHTLSKPEGIHSIGVYRVAKTKKFVAFMPHDEQVKGMMKNGGEADSFNIVLFPAGIEDYVKMGSVTIGTDQLNPGFQNPGGVGTMRVNLYPVSKTMQVQFAQSHYSSKSSEGKASRAFIGKYAGWRVHAMMEAIELARRHGCKLSISPTAIRSRDNDQLEKDIAQACKKLGVEMKKTIGIAIEEPEEQ